MGRRSHTGASSVGPSQVQSFHVHFFYVPDPRPREGTPVAQRRGGRRTSLGCEHDDLKEAPARGRCHHNAATGGRAGRIVRELQRAGWRRFVGPCRGPLGPESATGVLLVFGCDSEALMLFAQALRDPTVRQPNGEVTSSDGPELVEKDRLSIFLLAGCCFGRFL